MRSSAHKAITEPMCVCRARLVVHAVSGRYTFIRLIIRQFLKLKAATGCDQIGCIVTKLGADSSRDSKNSMALSSFIADIPQKRE